MPATIGKIVNSNSHVDYVCQVFGPGEIDRAPAAADYTFGTFVRVTLGAEDGVADEGNLVGIIYNTLLLNPEFGSLGPRLSPRRETEIFTPDYLAETATLVGIFAVGWLDAAGNPQQGVPPLAAAVNAPVARLEEDELRRFHQETGQENGRLSLRYVPLLLAQNNPLAPALLLAVLDQLAALFPANRGQLAVMRNNVAWKSIVQPAG
jgi:hypothetical protein